MDEKRLYSYRKYSLINYAIYSSGKRVKRGLYESAKGLLTSADAQAAANILRKVTTQLGLCLAEVGRASLTVPQRYDLFIRLNKSYRKRCVACLKTA